jgi:hypothetical protein
MAGHRCKPQFSNTMIEYLAHIVIGDLLKLLPRGTSLTVLVSRRKQQSKVAAKPLVALGDDSLSLSYT